ncbi:ESX secretion-associated protein EspG [Amycolatopsis cihanbeyliensis]|uniref:ESAT-6 protein secretion system EspG family protein n=1 Tax=Amycolatopsis cihanbeyliensis TaxID=1128664 RepID=A0A542DM56_AMYCI|nr:ESX secretion-associated protein EspG [Amycolatopsis cihanbeyliensis]TQJ04182.1 ESAT-6 protein secretion system EspG family protein [Amycolatopsis cihanbeyliensis]
MAHSFSLSLAAVDILLEHCGLGAAPFPFQLPQIGTTKTQRAQVRDAVFRDLESRGLAHSGRLDEDAELALRTIVRAPVAITAAAQLADDKKLFARVSSDGRFAVLARQDENLLVFEETRPTGLVTAIVDLLPLTPAAAGQSVTVPRPAPSSQPRRQAEDGGYDPFGGVSGPRGGGQLRMVERIFEKPKKRLGQFTALVQGQDGRQAPLGPLAWFDTEDGRYLNTMHQAGDGQQWITYAPADNARIAQQLYSQLEGYL